MKNKIKNAFNRFIGRMGTVKGRINWLEDRSIEITQAEKTKKKQWE